MLRAMPEEKAEDAKLDAALVALGARQWRIALSLTAAMFSTYFGFLLLVAYGKTMLGGLVFPGLSVGILLGALVIVVAWLLTGVYVRWANQTYDAELAALKKAIEARGDDA